MKIIAIEKECPNISPEAYTNALKKSEATRVWELYQSGALREFYFRQDRPEAVLIFECNSVEDCQALIASLPLVINKLIDFELIPLKPYPGFSRLF